MMIWNHARLIVTLVIRLLNLVMMNLKILAIILIMNLVISLLMNLRIKVFNFNNKSLIVYFNHGLLGFFSRIHT